MRGWARLARTLPRTLTRAPALTRALTLALSLTRAPEPRPHPDQGPDAWERGEDGLQLRGGVGASAAITDLLYRSAAFGIAEQLETHPLTPNPSPLTQSTARVVYWKELGLALTPTLTLT